MFTTFYVEIFFRSEHSGRRYGVEKIGQFTVNIKGVRFLWLPTSKCSNFTTTGPYSCRFHSRDNDDLYLTNLSQILKIHVDFRVICRHHQDNTPSISEDAELCDGSENRNDSFQFASETGEQCNLKIRKAGLR